MRINFSRFIIAAALSMVAFSILSAKTTKRWETEAQTRKADYIYLEALRHNMLSNEDAAYDLTTRAYDLNPSDPYVGWEKGVALLRLSQGDSAMVEDGVALMGEYVDSNPTDLYSSLILANILERLNRGEKAMAIWKTLHDNFPGRSEVTYRYADILSQSRDSDLRRSAVALYDSLEVSEGRSIQLTTQKMRLYFADSDTAAIINEVRSLLDSSPNSAEYNVFAGNVFGQFVGADSAMKYYDRAIELDPSSGLAYYSRANYFRSTNDSVAYDREVFQALRQPDLELGAKLEILQGYISDLYTDTLQQPRITDLFKVLTDQHPHEPDIHRLYMGYLIAIGDYAGAAEQADYALALEPSDEKGWLRLVSLYLQARENDKALDATERATRYYPDNATLYVFKGVGLSQLKRYDESIDAFRRGLQLTHEGDNVQLSELYTSIGDAFYAMGQSDSSFVYYEKAVELDPTSPTALNNCAYYMANSDRDLPKALEMIKKCMEMRPNDPTTLDTYAWVLFKLKRYEEAKEVIDQVLAESDADDLTGEVYDHAGDIYFMNQDPKEALDFWKKALELNPDDALLQRKVQHKTYFYE